MVTGILSFPFILFGRKLWLQIVGVGCLKHPEQLIWLNGFRFDGNISHFYLICKYLGLQRFSSSSNKSLENNKSDKLTFWQICKLFLVFVVIFALVLLVFVCFSPSIVQINENSFLHLRRNSSVKLCRIN